MDPEQEPGEHRDGTARVIEITCGPGEPVGDVASLLASEQFDLVVCRATVTDLDRPVHALDELHRILRPGGTAVIGAGEEDEDELLELARCSLFGGGEVRPGGPGQPGGSTLRLTRQPMPGDE